MTAAEFNKMKGFRFDQEAFDALDVLPLDENEAVANDIDWRNSGAVTGVKN